MILLFIVSRHIFFFPLIFVACVDKFPASRADSCRGCGELEERSVYSILEYTV